MFKAYAPNNKGKRLITKYIEKDSKVLSTLEPDEKPLFNGVSKFSLLNFLFHANYFWLTYGKYALIKYLYDNGLSLFGEVGVTILCYILIIPC